MNAKKIHRYLSGWLDTLSTPTMWRTNTVKWLLPSVVLYATVMQFVLHQSEEMAQNSIGKTVDVPNLTIIGTKHRRSEEIAQNSLKKTADVPNPTIIGTKRSRNDGSRNNNGDGDDWFKLVTGNDRVDRAYQLAMDEVRQSIKVRDGKDGGSPYFVAGAGWDQLWTRDTAYAVELGAGLVEPEVSRLSLQSCTEETKFLKRVQPKEEGDRLIAKKEKVTVWFQDSCLHFGAWPNLSDAIVGARGAWHLYLYTGDLDFLEWAHRRTVASLLRAEADALVDGDGHPTTFLTHGCLFTGCSSFMESNSGYPDKYAFFGNLVGRTKALSTNILYYNGYAYAYKMGAILRKHGRKLGKDGWHLETFRDRAKMLRNTIRERLWMEEKGLYGYFEDEAGKVVEQTEGLGIALALLSEGFETDNNRIRRILNSIHRTPVGIASLWPPFDLGTDGNPDIALWYHNGRIWPFVSGYIAIAAAKHGRPDIFAEEFANLVDLSEQENTFAEFYNLDKSFPLERSKQLWSDTGYLGMVYKGLFGMDFREDGIHFFPTKVEGNDGFLKMKETVSLLNVKYRRAILDIYLKGVGTKVISFRLNGETRELPPKLYASVTGRQKIEIEVGPAS